MAETSELGLNMPIPGRAGTRRQVPDTGVAALAMPTPRTGAPSPQSGLLTLRCLDGARPGIEYLLPDPGGLVGRQDPGEAIEPLCDLTEQEASPDERSVSRRHAEISRRGDQIVVIDLDSVNGTTLNGIRLVPGQPMPIGSGDVLVFGRVKLILS